MPKKNEFYCWKSGQRLLVRSVTAAPKYPSAANFILPFFFSALSLRNSLLCRRSRYQQPALHNAFKLSEHVKRAGKGSLLAGSAEQRSDWHKHTPRLFKSCSPTQVHFSPTFNRKDNFTKKNILAICCCPCWRLKTKTDAIYRQQYFYERLPWQTSASASIRSVTLTRALLYLYQLCQQTAFTVRLPWKPKC